MEEKPSFGTEMWVCSYEEDEEKRSKEEKYVVMTPETHGIEIEKSLLYFINYIC